ncbi:ROK family transcriptional regulator [Gynuella sunshinyii]|nr:ROK family transcriptional regulator [Gynuella sunshinyii]
MKHVVGNQKHIRNMNESLAIDLILRHGKISRADISREIGLSKPTVSSVVSRLLELNLIREIGPGENAQGRKATLLQLNQNALFVVGIDFSVKKSRVALANLNGDIVAQSTLGMNESGPESYMARLADHVTAVLQQYQLDWNVIHYVSFGVPAVVTPETGTTSFMVDELEAFKPFLSQPYLNRLFPANVILENDVNLSALAEYRYGVARKAPIFSYLSLGAGVGSALMSDGVLYRGSNGAAGEIGELLSPSGVKLEQCLSAQYIKNETAKYRELSDKLCCYGHQKFVDELFALVAVEDPEAVKVIREYGHFLAIAIQNLCVMYDPNIIVIGGSIGRHSDVLIPLVRPFLTKFLPVTPKLSGTELGENSVVIGAVGLAVKRSFDFIKNNLLVQES